MCRRRYAMSTCLAEAAIQEAHRQCSCYPGYLRASNKTCHAESLACFADVYSNLGTIGHKKSNKNNYILNLVGKYRQIVDNGEVKPCLAACVDQTFDLTVSSSSFPSEQTFNHRPHFCVIVRWLQSILSGNIHAPTRGRKLATQTCADTFARQLLARRHPGLCEELAAAVAGGDCGEAGVWSGRGLGGNMTRVKMVEDNILRCV